MRILKQIKGYSLLLIVVLSMFWSRDAVAQEEIMVDLSLIDGTELTPDNLFNIQIISNLNRTINSKIRGSVIYRKSNIRLSYSFSYTISPGINIIDANMVHATYEFSSLSLKELFTLYKKLPQGVYEYCVIIDSGIPLNEVSNQEFSQCLFHKTEDLFFINLVYPENNAKIYEYNPNLSWMASFPFASELNYKLRVVELKKGQSAVTAISRNNPIYEEGKHYLTSKIYPVYARPLVKDQPYVWTVDAYYKDLLLGGAEPWVFTIIEDSIVTGVPKDPSYIDIKRETGQYELFAPGLVKLKYELKNERSDSLSLTLMDANNNVIKLAKEYQVIKAETGDNRYIIDFHKTQPLKHKKEYRLIIENKKGEQFKIIFKYINPDLIR